jgi:hypothetical protein
MGLFTWLAILGCATAARLAVQRMPSGLARESLFVSANLAAIYLLFFAPIVSLSIRIGVPILYLGLLAANYLLLYRFAHPRARCFWLSFLGPLLMLTSLRCLPWNSFAARLHMAWVNEVSFGGPSSGSPILLSA